MAQHQLTQMEILTRAINFSKKWESAKSEKSQGQDFIRAFLNVFTTKEIRGEFEKLIKIASKTTNWIDYYSKGLIAIEMKSKGKRLDNAFEQLKGYMEHLPENERPPLWMVSDFDNIHIYYPSTDQTYSFKTNKLRKHLKHFNPIAGYDPEPLRAEKNAVDVQAAEKMTKLFDALQEHGYIGHELEVYLARLLFCLFANDTGIFNQDSFHNYIENSAQSGSDLDVRLARLFQDLNEPEKDRVKCANISNGFDLTEFRFINGKLFEEQLRLAVFDKKMRQTLLDCLDFDWSQISPAIFGSMFQGIMNKELRREIGAHYTSEQNIKKVIDPLFLDELKAEFNKIKQKSNYVALSEFRDKIANLKFLDPACGCGNFLIIAYQKLRLLELEIKREQKKLLTTPGVKTQKGITKHTKGIDHSLIDVETDIQVKIENFYGIEILSWPCQIAKTGMWLMEHKMNLVFSEEFGKYVERIPLEEGATIVHANALRTDWESVVPKSELNYILGNPPFVGYAWRSEPQHQDMDIIFQAETRGHMDYVAAWFKKASTFVKETDIQVAFVATNSICQGEQVMYLWKPLIESGIKIDFAHRTFKWSNEAKGKAAVHCIITGFSFGGLKSEKIIFENEKSFVAQQINPYLLSAPNVFVEGRSKPICDIPVMSMGNMPRDGGNLILNQEERDYLIKHEPNAKKYIRRFSMGEEFINNILRYCLWLIDCPPSELGKMPLVLSRVEKVRQLRLKSKAESTRQKAKTPTIFGQLCKMAEGENYIAVPKVSSERRDYIPIGFLDMSCIPGDKLFVIPNADLYHFGILTSSVHMAWMRAVCGRLKSDYSYSNTIVYNNFPWPDVTKKSRAEIEKLAQGVLNARLLYPDESLANLYDPLKMPPKLTNAHSALDRAVIKLYGFNIDLLESELVARLVELYKEMILN